MRAVKFSVVGERVTRNRDVRTEGRHLHVADVAALPRIRLVLQTLNELVPRLRPPEQRPSSFPGAEKPRDREGLLPAFLQP